MSKSAVKSNPDTKKHTKREGKMARSTHVWLSALKQSWQASIRVDRSQVTAFQSIRSTIGVIIPLAIGVLTGNLTTGVLAGGGALMLAGVGLTYTYRGRNRTMLLDCLFIAFSAFIGSITGNITWLAVLVIGIWGIGAGILASISTPMLVVGLQSCIAVIVMTHFKLPPVQAIEEASLWFGGALFQVLLAIIPSPWTNTTPERSVLVSVYQQLAEYAGSVADMQKGLLVSNALVQAHSIISTANMHSQQGKLYVKMLDVAEQIRLSLLVLASLREDVIEGTTLPENVSECLRHYMRSSKAELQDIAQRLKPLSKLSQATEDQGTGALDEMKEVLSQVREQAQATGDDQTLSHILIYCDTLCEQVKTADELSKSWRQAHTFLPIHIHFPNPHPSRLSLHYTMANLRANLTPRSTAFRHAVRLGVALAIATALYEYIPLPIMQRGYWIPLTTVLVLRSDFATTFTRGISRLLGTLLGAVLTTLLVVLLAPSHIALLIILTIAAYLAYSVLFANYAVFSVIITMEVVFLLSFVFPQTLEFAEYRAINTAIGGVLALLLFLIWPTWEQTQLGGNLAQRVESLRRYIDAVLRGYIDPDAYDVEAVDKLRNESRLSRSNANASVQRALNEPVSYVKGVHLISPETAQGLLGAADNIARNTIALEAYIEDTNTHRTHALPGIETFKQDLEDSLDKLASAIRENHAVANLPDLQEALHPMQVNITDAHAQDGAEIEERFAFEEAREMIPNIRVMQQLLSKHANKHS
jgi:uncharacterized membrane protein YccC